MIAIGLIFMMGFAGSAAAQEDISVDLSGGDGGDGGDAAVSQSLDQENNNAQVGTATAENTDDSKYTKYSSSSASASVTQEQNVGQSNIGEQNAIAVGGAGGDGGDGGQIDIDLDVDDGPVFPPGPPFNGPPGQS